MLLSEIVDDSILKDLLPKEAGKFIYDQKEIVSWLNRSQIATKKLSFQDGKVNAKSVVCSSHITHFAVEWGEIEDSFLFEGGSLRTLIGGPKRVGEMFSIRNNQVYSLAGAPEYVGGNCDLSYNRLSSLDHAPKEVHKSFDVADNRLESLENGPVLVNGYYNCSNNKLKNLKGIPSRVDGSLIAPNNFIDSLDGFPTQVDGYINIAHNKLTSLAGIDKIIKKMNGSLYIDGNPIISNILGVMKINGLSGIIPGLAKNTVSLNLLKACEIVTKHIGDGNKGILAAQQELIDADLEDFAEF